jgi:hypothetical protein
MKYKTLSIALVLAIVLSTVSCATRTGARARLVYPDQARIVDVSFFYDELSPYGRWFQLDEYGWVWTPYGMSYGWRPYTNGYWVWTDWGWTWVSAWRWGWAPFHYGRWHHHARHGWLWIPGTVWAPAWVIWRHRPGWIGWSPLPPQVGWRAGFGLDFGNVNIDRVIEPHYYSFVEERLFSARNLHQHIQLEARNVSLLRDTRSIVDYSDDSGRVVNRGVAVEQIERDTGQKIRRHRLVDASAARPDEVRGEDVVVFRPKLEKKQKERVPRVTEPAPTTLDKEQRKLEKQHAAQQAELEKQQRKEQQRLEEQQRIEEKQKRKEQQRLEEQQRIRQKQERKKAKPSEAAPPKRQNLEPKPSPKPLESVALRDLDNKHKAEKQALKEQRQREEQILRNRLEVQRKVQPPPSKPSKQKPAKSSKP